jgi:hypothetical protein
MVEHGGAWWMAVKNRIPSMGGGWGENGGEEWPMGCCGLGLEPLVPFWALLSLPDHTR